MNESLDSEGEEPVDAFDEGEFERRWRHVEAYNRLREAMLDAKWRAQGAWKRYIGVPTQALQRGFDLVEAHRWMRRHVRLASPRLHARYSAHPSPADLLPHAVIHAIERRMEKLSKELHDIDSVSGDQGLVALTKALAMDGRERGPKFAKSQAERSRAVTLMADMFARTVALHLTSLQLGTAAQEKDLPSMATAAEVFERVGTACDRSASTTRKWWFDEIKRADRAEWKKLFEKAQELSEKLRPHREKLEREAAPADGVKVDGSSAKQERRASGRAQVKRSNERIFARK